VRKFGDRVSLEGGVARRRVLVVDDYEDVTEVVCDLVEALGHVARACYRGRDALDLASALSPDIVMIDISLPDMSGYDVARALRACPQGTSLNLIAVTGFSGSDARMRALDAGFDQHVVKPLNLATLARIVGPAMPR